MFCSGVWLLLLVSLQQQRKSQPDQIQPHLLRNSLPSIMNVIVLWPICMYTDAPPPHTSTHMYAHICTHMCTLRNFLYTKLFARHFLLSVLPSTMQVDIITKEETGLVSLNIVSEVTHRAKFHSQVGQPPNLAFLNYKKGDYKIPSYSPLSLS